MTLDEAIKHCEDKYHELIFKSECGEDGCLACAEEYEQLSEWLEELKVWRSLKLICANEGIIVYKIKEAEND